MNTVRHQQHTIRFRRWSRKSYAMFYSLGKCVTIGNLKKEIADISLGKQNHVCTAFSVCQSMRKDDAEKEYGEEEAGLLERVVLSVFQIQLSRPQEDYVASYFDKIIFMPKGCAIHSSGFFLF